mgnify:CR=1 FL=1
MVQLSDDNLLEYLSEEEDLPPLRPGLAIPAKADQIRMSLLARYGGELHACAGR